jgi:Flp pilus assembly protein TadG
MQKKRSRQNGAAAVEFALVVSVFLTLLFGVIEMSRVLFYMNTAAEATRLGARVAVVCDINAAAIRTRMRNMLGILSDANIDITYLPAGCDISSCQTVTVSIDQGQGALDIATYIPFVPLTVRMPAFSTTLPRESLSSANNAICN